MSGPQDFFAGLYVGVAFCILAFDIIVGFENFSRACRWSKKANTNEK